MLAGGHATPGIAQITRAGAAVTALQLVLRRPVRVRARLRGAIDQDGERIDVRRQRAAEATDDRINVALIEREALAVYAGQGDRKRLRRRGGGDGSGDRAEMVRERGAGGLHQ